MNRCNLFLLLSLLMVVRIGADDFTEWMDRAEQAPTLEERLDAVRHAVRIAPDDARKLAAVRDGFARAQKYKMPDAVREFAQLLTECRGVSPREYANALFQTLCVEADGQIPADWEAYLALAGRDPARDFEAWCRLSDAYVAYGEVPKAIACLERLLAKPGLASADRIDARLKLVKLYCLRLDFDRALAAYDLLLKEKMPSRRYYDLVLDRLTLLQTGVGFYYTPSPAALAEVRKSLDALLDAAGTPSDIYFTALDRYLRLYEQTGDRKKVIELCKKALSDKKRSLGPKSYAIMMKLGRAQLEDVDLEGAVETLQKLDSTFHNGDTARWLGEAYYSSRRVLLALGSFEESLRLLRGSEDERSAMVGYALNRTRTFMKNAALYDAKMKARMERLKAEDLAAGRTGGDYSFVSAREGAGVAVPGAPAKKKPIRNLKDINVETGDLASEGLDLD